MISNGMNFTVPTIHITYLARTTMIVIWDFWVMMGFTVNFGFERGELSLILNTWARLPERESQDDNPDLTSYLGYEEIWAGTGWRDYHLALMFRNNLRVDENRSALQFEVSFPPIEHFNGYIQYFTGYGESLTDYNHFTNRIGVGFMVKDW
jgi:phospholipase A1